MEMLALGRRNCLPYLSPFPVTIVWLIYALNVTELVDMHFNSCHRKHDLSKKNKKNYC